MKLTKRTPICIVLCFVLAMALTVSVFAYLDKYTGEIGGNYCEGLLYEGSNNGYRACTYVSTSGSNVDTIWAKVELVVAGDRPSTEKYGSSNEVDTNECTSDLFIASVRGYHYIELVTGDTWGSYSSSYTLYLT